MRRLCGIIGMLALAGVSATAQVSPGVGVSLSPTGASISFDFFFSSLGPYGEWVAVDNSVYAWRPVNVGGTWRPYYNGRWAWTDYGWYWASEEPWAWATYHYGRWYYDDYYGWMWMPGYDWAPAWVEWRIGGDYCGWAPLGPYALFSASWGIYYARPWMTPYSYWCFAPCGYMGNDDLYHHVYRTEDNARIIGRTRSVGSVRSDGGRIVTRGPEREYIERRGNLRVPRADLVDVESRDGQRIVRNGEHERIEVFRPRIAETPANGSVVRPERVRTGERTISLDTRNIDGRSRSVAREQGRDLRRLEDYIRGPSLRRDDVPDRHIQTNKAPDQNRLSGQARGRQSPQPGTVDREQRPQPDIRREAPRQERRYEQPRIERRDPERIPRINAPQRQPQRIEPQRQNSGGQRADPSPPRSGRDRR